MSAHKDDNFGNRLSAAANAKKAMLERFRARPSPNDPATLERQAARKAISDARDARIAERKAARAAEAARLADEEKAKIAEQAAQKAETLRGAATLAAEQKAARDARYAARKMRRR